MVAMTRAEFQAFVLDVLRERFPERDYAAGDCEDLIVCGSEQFGLHNLQARCGNVEADDGELRELVASHFNRMAQLAELHGANDSPAWSIIQPRLRPQIMPAEFTRQVPIVHLPLGATAEDGAGEDADVLIGIALDSEAGYSYVRLEDAALWGRTPEELFETALENLKDASRELPMAMFPEPNLAIVIETKDGYDAARILIPDLREFVAGKLGEPFFAGIPNRDFLIMWSRDASQEFQTFCRQKIAEDFGQQDHPLSPRILVATVDGLEVEETG
jgi:hypothetical protein